MLEDEALENILKRLTHDFEPGIRFTNEKSIAKYFCPENYVFLFLSRCRKRKLFKYINRFKYSGAESVNAQEIERSTPIQICLNFP